MSTPHERLTQARKDAGFRSAQEAADALGVPYGTYSGHENGERNFRIKTAATYAEKFSVSAAWLLFGEDQSLSDLNDPAARARNEIRSRLKTLISQHGLTPSAVARKAGLTPSTLNRFFDARSTLTLGNTTLAKVADVFGMTYLELVGTDSVGSNPSIGSIDGAEEVARALCRAKGLDPDQPIWTMFKKDAERAISDL